MNTVAGAGNNFVENIQNNAVNMMNSVNSAVNVAANNTIAALNNSVGDTGGAWFWISVVGLLAVIIGAALWKLGYIGLGSSPVFPVPTTTTLPPPVPERAVAKEETWCFVGEDMTGRWCVRVPHRGACDSERAYSSRSDCELTEGSRLPLGTNMNGGAKTLSLMGPPPSSQPIG